MNKWGFLNLLLALALSAVLLLLAAMHTNPGKRNDYWIKGMNESPAPADYSANAEFANGQTLQMPPDGTLPQGAEAYHYQGGVDDANKAGKELKNPLDAQDPAVLERGKNLYMRDCLPCHGIAGRGDGPATMARRDGGVPGTASLQEQHAKDLPDGYIYNYISRGGILMPSYGAQIDAKERWKVVAWVRYLQKNLPVAPPADGSPESLSEIALVASTTPGYGYSEPGVVKPASTVAAWELNPAPTPEPAQAAGAEVGSGDPWSQALPLIAKTDCFTCHNPDRKVIGPAYRDVAKRYRDKPDALAQLVKKVKLGGAGNWGQVPMSAHPNVSDQDLETIIKGILSLPDKGGHAQAPSMKRVMELVHSGAPVNCPALAGEGAINGPAYLASRSEPQAEVRRIRPEDSDGMMLGSAPTGQSAQEARP